MVPHSGGSRHWASSLWMDTLPFLPLRIVFLRWFTISPWSSSHPPLRLAMYWSFKFFWLHGLPADIVCKCRPQFTSQVGQAFRKAFGSTCSLTSRYHPQSNGQTETANQDLETASRCFTTPSSTSWSSFLPWVEYAHNLLSSSFSRRNDPIHGCLWISTASSLRPGGQDCCSLSPCSCCLVPGGQRSQRSQRLADCHQVHTPQYQLGKKVWLSYRDLPLQVESHKLAPHFAGPFEVDHIVNPTVTRLKVFSRALKFPLGSQNA